MNNLFNKVIILLLAVFVANFAFGQKVIEDSNGLSVEQVNDFLAMNTYDLCIYSNSMGVAYDSYKNNKKIAWRQTLDTSNKTRSSLTMGYLPFNERKGKYKNFFLRNITLKYKWGEIVLKKGFLTKITLY